MNPPDDVIVIGEGITGLCVAFWLKKAGVRVRVLAKGTDAGGTMRSVREGGFLFETGANSALETTPLFNELVQDLHLEDEFLHAAPSGKNRFIMRNGSLHALPMSPPAFFATHLFSLSAKLRLLAEPFIGRGTEEESIAQFVSRRLGQEFLDYAIDPFVAGVFAGRPDRLSVRSAFPKLYALEKNYGGLIRGMIGGARERKKRAEKSKDRAETFAFRSGMQTFPTALATTLKDEISFGTRATAVRRDVQPTGASLFTVTAEASGATLEFSSRQVILAVPAFEASRLIQEIGAQTSRVLDSIYYSPIVSVFLGFRREDVRHPLNGFGYLIPTRERRKILGCLWNSSLFPGRAPDGMVAVNAFVGGSRQPEMTQENDEAILSATIEELRGAMQIQGKPVYLHMTRWDKSIPQYEIGYQEKMDALSRFESENPGVMLAGNYRGGISVGDCVMSARRIAETIAVQFGRSVPKVS